MRAEGKHCLFNVVECPSCALMLPRVHCPDRNTSHCFINGLTGKRPRLWSWGWICSVAPSLLEMRVTVLQASVMWCLIFQQVTGRGLWGAEEPHGGLAGVLYPMALKLHLCSAPQSWPLPELLHSYGHTNLLTLCLPSCRHHSDYRTHLTMGTISESALLFFLTCCWMLSFPA